MRRIGEWLMDNIKVIIEGVVVFALAAIAATIFMAEWNNANNRITEGFVIDKQYRAAYTTTTYSGTGKSRIAIPHRHPERYIFTIEGDKGGRTVRYTLDVTETQYEQYSIGDYFTM